MHVTKPLCVLHRQFPQNSKEIGVSNWMRSWGDTGLWALSANARAVSPLWRLKIGRVSYFSEFPVEARQQLARSLSLASAQCNHACPLSTRLAVFLCVRVTQASLCVGTELRSKKAYVCSCLCCLRPFSGSFVLATCSPQHTHTAHCNTQGSSLTATHTAPRSLQHTCPLAHHSAHGTHSAPHAAPGSHRTSLLALTTHGSGSPLTAHRS